MNIPTVEEVIAFLRTLPTDGGWRPLEVREVPLARYLEYQPHPKEMARPSLCSLRFVAPGIPEACLAFDGRRVLAHESWSNVWPGAEDYADRPFQSGRVVQKLPYSVCLQLHTPGAAESYVRIEGRTVTIHHREHLFAADGSRKGIAILDLPGQRWGAWVYFDMDLLSIQDAPAEEHDYLKRLMLDVLSIMAEGIDDLPPPGIVVQPASNLTVVKP